MQDVFIKIGNQTIPVPAGMSVKFNKNGSFAFIPVAHKSTKSQTVHPPKPAKPVYDPAQTKKFYSKENLEAIKSFFIAKNGITTDADAISLAETLEVPVGMVKSQFRKKSLAVCFGAITLPNVNVFLAHCASQNPPYRAAQLYHDPKIVAERQKNLAKGQNA